MKNLLLVFVIFTYYLCQSQTKIVSWNIENLGRSKSESEIQYIAETIKVYDIIAIQEVVAGQGGAQAVATLCYELNQMGNKWDYVVSDPTTSSAYKTERYAFIWKTKKIKKIGDAWLEQKFNLEIDREPFYCTFEVNKKRFTLVNFHAITKKRQPETEIKYFRFLPAQYPNLNLIFLGDFNIPQSHSVFIPLRNMGYQSALVGQKTSLKRKCRRDVCLASEFDNFFYDQSKNTITESGITHFYLDFGNLREARSISDHVPIFIHLIIKPVSRKL